MKTKLYTFIEQAAIEEKISQLQKVKNGSMTPKELAAKITERRVNWMIANLHLLEKYSHLPPEEMAHRIICLEHMNINPGHSKVRRIEEGVIRINSYNFCPYLIACRELEMDTRFVCKEIGEPSIIEMCKLINPNLTFLRDYTQLRPHFPHFCREYIIDTRNNLLD